MKVAERPAWLTNIAPYEPPEERGGYTTTFTMPSFVWVINYDAAGNVTSWQTTPWEEVRHWPVEP